MPETAISVSEGEQRTFLTWVRPPIILATFIVFAVLEAIVADGPGRFVVAVAAFALVTSPLFALAARRYRPGVVLRAALAFDTVVIAAMTAGLARADLFVLGFVWSMTVAAFLFGHRETLAFCGLSLVAAVVAPQVSAIDIDAVTLGTDVLALAVAGGMLALLARNARAAEAALARERAYDAAALEISERIRSSLALDEVLRLAVEELGEATHAMRSAIRLRGDGAGEMQLIQWARPGTPPLDLPEPPGPIRRIFDTAEPLVETDVAAASADVQAFARFIGARSIAFYPISWQNEVVGVIGLADDRPRDWDADALPLLARLAPQIRAALAQAELFEQQGATVARLEEISRLREELVATVSHELRTPLTSALGFLQTLERTDVSFAPEERRRFLMVARTEAERLAVLVDDLLELARVDRGAIRLQPEPVPLAELVDDAVRGLGWPAGREVTVDVADDLVAHADRGRLLQILVNLLANALRHGEGSVRVAGVRDGDSVSLLVSDEGPGIPAERAAEVFLPFARAADESGGAGLGLAIARGLAEAHGGSLVYRPTENGQPHAFVLRLPSAVAAAGSERAAL